MQSLGIFAMTAFRHGNNRTLVSFFRQPAPTEALQDRQVFSGESFTELAVHIEHVAGTHDIAFADFSRGRMTHRSGRFDGGVGKYGLATGKL